VSTKKPICLHLIFSRCLLKEFTTVTLTASRGRLFHLFTSRSEKKYSLASQRLCDFVNFQPWPGVRPVLASWKNESIGTVEMPRIPSWVVLSSLLGLFSPGVSIISASEVVCYIPNLLSYQRILWNGAGLTPTTWCLFCNANSRLANNMGTKQIFIRPHH